MPPVYSKMRAHAPEAAEESGQLSLIAAADNELIQKLKDLDVNTLTPIEALQKLFELSKEAAQY